MTSISKNVYIDKLDEIVNKYNNTFQQTVGTFYEKELQKTT